jgi:hypothetical protein
MHLHGDLYNGLRAAKNLVLDLDDSSISGVISSSTARHRTSTITAADYKQLGEVTNTPGPAVNNGVVVTLAGHSTWSVTGTSYLTHLTVGANAGVVGANGRHVQMTVDGVPTAISPGHTYTGAVTLSLR